MENPEIKRFIEARAEDAKLVQSRANMACDSCMAVIIADFDFRLGPITNLVHGFAEYVGSGYDTLEWRVIR